MNNVYKSIKNWSPDDRPREKMLQKGVHAISDSELLAILINQGSREKNVTELAKELLALCQNNLVELGKLSLYDLQKIKGIGAAKATTIYAAIELGRRRFAGNPTIAPAIRSSADMAVYLREVLKDFPHEVFAVLFLNQANKVKHFEIISKGGITGTVADPRLIFKKALEKGATSLILSHNHPSGNLCPSRADETLTEKMKLAASYLDLRILDHIIVSEEGYYSFADEGKL